ncbi:splicing regulator SDE2 isoform X1 [Gadus chalcogrammus]|uniref:splicing regulator SDE2 isoform X1 n=1 Tax=Gadus chalcogrammus TaxID=1042646 RepID=UPI0024C21C5B|nr:splicing regulator SDE2 isoform X1 [Gadus chalcogrammus]
MELFVSSSALRFSNVSLVSLPVGSRVGDLVQDVLTDHGLPTDDFYVTTNGRVSGQAELLLQGSVYHLEPRLCGGKGGFGSMLRALGAQIEKTTNREACRDLSGRRLRDVNHEKEMAEWLKKQAELEGEKDQRRVERLQRKLVEPKHHFTDPDYQQQCHDLSERLEDSVLKGMQASSSGVVSAEAGPSTKRAKQHPASVPKKKKRFWSGVGDLDLDSEEEDEDEALPGPSHPTRPKAAVPSSSTPARPSAEPVSTGSRQPEPVSTSSDKPKPEPVSTSSDQPEPEQMSTGSDQPEPVSSGSDQPEPVSTGSDQPEPVSTSSDQPEPEPVSTGSDQPETEPTTQINQDPQPTEPQPTEPQPTQAAPQQVHPPLDLDAAGSPEDLEAAGLDQLKEALRSRGLKCGGTLKERASRLFSVRGLTAEQIDPLLRAKTSAKGKK